jgi:hypothetical protein
MAAHEAGQYKIEVRGGGVDFLAQAEEGKETAHAPNIRSQRNLKKR